MNHDKIYKKTVIGKTQVWHQERVGPRYRTHSGQLGGAIVVSEWTLALAKNVGRANATTAEEQARLEVEANYTLKLKTGYSTTTDAAETDTRFSPMLAKPFEEYKTWLKEMIESGIPVWSQPKLDGIRCIADASGLWSRKGNKIVACPHIETTLGPFFKKLPDLRLDGELYLHDLSDDFNSIVSAVKKTKPTAQDLQISSAIEYHVYDSPSAQAYDRRLQRFGELADSVGSPMVAVRTDAVASMSHLDELYDAYLTDNYEGQIIRVQASYEEKRTKYLLKRKETVDKEFILLDVVEGIGNKAGMAGAAIFDLGRKDGVTFDANIRGDRNFLRSVLKHKASLIGKKATVLFNGYTPAGKPRFGRVKEFARGNW